jgi:hypothetical protein
VIEKRELKTFTNLEKVFIVVDYEAFKTKCDFRHKSASDEYCGTFGLTEQNQPVKCSIETCPYVYAIVTEVKENDTKKPTYVQ